MTKERACASKFGLSGENPVDRLMSAIAILQAYYLAQDTNLNAEHVFGSMHMKSEGIEHVIRILIEVLEFVDDAGDTDMTRTLDQNANDMEIAKMRMDQARDKLADAIIAGKHDQQPRLEKVHAAAISDYHDLKQERAFMLRHDYA